MKARFLMPAAAALVMIAAPAMAAPVAHHPRAAKVHKAHKAKPAKKANNAKAAKATPAKAN